MLENISLLQNKLKNFLKNENNEKVLYHWLKSELAYTSNAIEGNTLTRKETELVIEENITSSSKPLTYYLEAKNHANAFNQIIEWVNTNQVITEKEILNLHKIILNGINDKEAGFYRNCAVRISGSRVLLPNPMKVPLLMEHFCNWLNEQDFNNPNTAILAHLKLVSIHPFVDGNGRCARLLMNALLLKVGFAPIIIRPTDRKRYLSAIEKAQLTQVETDYIKYMQSILLRSLKIVIDILDTTKEDVKQKDLLTIAKFAKLVNCNASAIRYWVKQGKIEPYTYTDSGYMLFNISQVAKVKEIMKNR